MSKIFEQLVQKRGIGEDFLHPRYEALTDPFVFPGMKEVVKRIKQAINRGEKILVFGDYDVDGVTASTLMAEALQLAGVAAENIEIMLPDRFKDGYGMSSRVVEQAEIWGAKLVITVDTGSRNPEVIEELKRHGIDTIVTDHHECGWELTGVGAEVPEVKTAKTGENKKLGPIAGLVALINPKRPDFPEKYAYLRDLAGVGVAFKVAQALVEEGLIKAGQEKWLLDLVVIGTICDNMPLTGENRILSFYGMKVLEKTRRVGLRELMRRAGVRSLTSDAIGFQLGPRLNAAGRLKTADLALKLVRSKSAAEAAALAEELEELNVERKNKQMTAMREIGERGVGAEPVIIEIIAGRLVEKYHKPTFVLTEVAQGVLKGSGRSFGEFDLAAALDHAKDTLIRGGGHAGAAGVSLKREKLSEFQKKINQFYRGLQLTDQERFLEQKADLRIEKLADLSLELIEEIKLLEPFGESNANPIFRLTGVEIVAAARMGAEQNHLRLNVKDSQGKNLKLVAFFAPERWLNLTPDDQVEILVQLEKNEYQGVNSVEGRIIGVDFL